ncbi:MAG: non-canonical purine NTP pyrophosphatase [Thermoguttaceae bacterium]
MKRGHVLVLGTANRKKARELEDLLAPLGLELKSLAAFPDPLDIPEQGASLAENAVLKATRQAQHLHQWVLADDSGLMVDALGGEPGVHSARYSGPQATDQSNNRLLLDKLSRTPLEQRTARFVCHMALSDPSGAIRAHSEASCRGRILLAPEGTGGFGYDPLFEIIEYHRSFADLGPVVKACLSHRARAARLLIPQIVQLIQTGQWRAS